MIIKKKKQTHELQFILSNMKSSVNSATLAPNGLTKILFGQKTGGPIPSTQVIELVVQLDFT